MTTTAAAAAAVRGFVYGGEMRRLKMFEWENLCWCALMLSLEIVQSDCDFFRRNDNARGGRREVMRKNFGISFSHFSIQFQVSLKQTFLCVLKLFDDEKNISFLCKLASACRCGCGVFSHSLIFLLPYCVVSTFVIKIYSNQIYCAAPHPTLMSILSPPQLHIKSSFSHHQVRHTKKKHNEELRKSPRFHTFSFPSTRAHKIFSFPH